MDISLDYIKQDEDQRGRRRVFVRIKGRTLRIKETPGTKKFMDAYIAAVAQLRGMVDAPPPPDPSTPAPAKLTLTPGTTSYAPNTLGWLADLYMTSKTLKALSGSSQKATKRVLKECLMETVAEGSADRFGDMPLQHVDPIVIRRLRNLKDDAGFPAAANARRKYLSAMFVWGINANDQLDGKPLCTQNPVSQITPVNYKKVGHHTWTVEEVEQFRKRHATGSRARLALEMLLFIGQRGVDFVKLGPQHLTMQRYDDGVERRAFKFTPSKTSSSTGVELVIPVLPRLWQTIQETSPIGTTAYLLSARGTPFASAGSFQNWFAERCIEAGVPGRAHGLRKAGATIAANEGATVPMLMAMFGWASPQQAMEYVKKADQRRLALQGMSMIDHADTVRIAM